MHAPIIEMLTLLNFCASFCMNFPPNIDFFFCQCGLRYCQSCPTNCDSPNMTRQLCLTYFDKHSYFDFVFYLPDKMDSSSQTDYEYLCSVLLMKGGISTTNQPWHGVSKTWKSSNCHELTIIAE